MGRHKQSFLKSTPDKLKAEIAHQKEELVNTLESARENLNMGEMLDSGIDYVTTKSNEIYSTSKKYVQKHPTQVGFAALGLASVMAAGIYMSNPARASKVRKMVTPAKKTSQWQDTLKDTAQEAQEKIVQKSQDVATSVETMTQEHPLMTACLGAALGIAIGSVLPRTRFENDNIGPFRNQAVSKVQESAEQLMTDVKEAVGQTLESLEAKLMSGSAEEEKATARKKRQG